MEDTEDRTARFSFSFTLSRHVYGTDRVSSPNRQPTTLGGKLGIAGAPLSIQFSPSWRSRCQEDRPAGRFVFPRLPRKKDDGSRLWKEGRKGKKRGTRAFLAG